MEKYNWLDFGRITAIMTGSTILGIFLGSRTGGTYTFEVGANLMIVLLVLMILVSCLAISNMWLGHQK